MWVAGVTASWCLWAVRAVSITEQSSTSCSTRLASTTSTVAPTGTNTSGSGWRTSCLVGCNWNKKISETLLKPQTLGLCFILTSYCILSIYCVMTWHCRQKHGLPYSCVPEKHLEQITGFLHLQVMNSTLTRSTLWIRKLLMTTAPSCTTAGQCDQIHLNNVVSAIKVMWSQGHSYSLAFTETNPGVFGATAHKEAGHRHSNMSWSKRLSPNTVWHPWVAWFLQTGFLQRRLQSHHGGGSQRQRHLWQSHTDEPGRHQAHQPAVLLRLVRVDLDSDVATWHICLYTVSVLYVFDSKTRCYQ